MPPPSPFPGMDPYLEPHWRDVHQSLVIYARDALQRNLPPDLIARVEERVIVDAPEERRAVYPDVRVLEHGSGRSPGTTAAAVATAEPLVLEMQDESFTEGFIEIIEVGSANRVITVIEFISLTNKASGEGRRLYRRKRRELQKGKVGLVEIDLLRGGRWALPVPREMIPLSHRTEYQVCVRRGWRARTYEIYRVALRERLPAIKVPLRKTDRDVPLDLQAMIDQAYQNGRYDTLDYTLPPNPPLKPADAGWAAELLNARAEL